MGRRPVDWVNWRLYRRTWVLCAVAVLLAMVTSFRPQTPPAAPLPPTFTDERAAEVVAAATRYDRMFPDRRPGSPGAVAASQWVVEELDRLQDVAAQPVTATTTPPHTEEPISITNAVAVLPGRSTETIVVYGGRDSATAQGDAGTALSTMALVELARELSLTRDRRRTFVFISTDASTDGDAGARAAAQMLLARGGDALPSAATTRPMAMIGLDRIGGDAGELHVPMTPSGKRSIPLGLLMAGRQAVVEEGGTSDTPPLSAQVLRLGAPFTLYEHGPFVRAGLPAITLTTAPEQGTAAAQTPQETAAAAGASLRAVQRILGTLDAVDALQSAGKTYAMSGDRVYRGWALKIVIAMLLLPFWVAVVDLLTRLRHRWNLARGVGSVARAMMAGVWAAGMFWLIGAIGLLPGGSDPPHAPASVGSAPAGVLALWVLLGAIGWIFTRGPDWRRADVTGPDHAVLAVALVVLGLLAAVGLSTNPYAVVFALPTLHAWLWLASRHAHGTPAIMGIWAAGLLGPLVAVITLALPLNLGAWQAVWYWLELVRSQAVPSIQALLLFCAAGAGLIALHAARGTVAVPLILRLRAARDRFLEADGITLQPALRRRLRPERSRTPHARAGSGLPQPRDLRGAGSTLASRADAGVRFVREHRQRKRARQLRAAERLARREALAALAPERPDAQP